MSANYWNSTQRKHWQFTKDELASMRQKLEDDNAELVRLFPLPQPRHLAIYFYQQLLKLGKRLTIRQQAMATAQVYLKRFYARVEIRRTNPYLLIATSIYLACKMEEAPQHIRLIVTEARQLWQDFIGLDSTKIGECEFLLISEMSSQLIVHQPYRTLTALRSELSLTDEDVQLAKSVINDHYMTDLPFLCSPHVAALVAILLALVLRPNTSLGIAGAQNSPVVVAAGLAAAQAALSQANASRSAAATAAVAGPLSNPHPHSQSHSLPYSHPHSHPHAHSSSSSSSSSSLAANAFVQGAGSHVDTSLAAALDSKEKQQEARITRVQYFAAWLAESNVDIAAMVDATQEIISFYECYEQYNDKLTREQINRFVKARNLDK